MNLENFDWGWMDKPTNRTLSMDGITKSYGQWHKDAITQEIFKDKLYEKFFTVEEGDIVMDFGASIGPFTYSILDKKPKHVYCIEPSEVEFKTLNKNFQGYPVTPILKGIYSENTNTTNPHVYFTDGQMEGITFKRICELYNINHINFLKQIVKEGNTIFLMKKILILLLIMLTKFQVNGI